MKASDYRQLVAGKGTRAPRSNKYGARKTHCGGGHTHDSQREAMRCDHLHLMQRAGAISDLQQQPAFWFAIDGVAVKYPNGRRVGVTFDFAYQERGRSVVEDSKGMRVRDWPLRRAIFEALHPDIEVRET
jgi:hypothetical protein